MSFCNRFSSACVFSANRLKDRIDPFGESAFVIVVPKMWFDPMFGDVECSNVWKRAFEAVARLDEHFPVLGKDEQDDTVALFFLSNTPRLRDALRVSRNVIIALHFRKHRDHNLV